MPTTESQSPSKQTVNPSDAPTRNPVASPTNNPINSGSGPKGPIATSVITTSPTKADQNGADNEGKNQDSESFVEHEAFLFFMIGISALGVALCLVIAICCFWYIRKKRNKEKYTQKTENDWFGNEENDDL